MIAKKFLKYLGFLSFVCLVVLPLCAQADGHCSFDGIDGTEGCILIVNGNPKSLRFLLLATFPLSNHYSILSVPVNVTSRSFLQYSLDVIDCNPQTYSPCVLSFLVLSHSTPFFSFELPITNSKLRCILVWNLRSFQNIPR
jgi:hypothetical protein